MELLAPVGSIPALKAAVKAGADAVYLGLGEHNARIKSADFNEYNLREWIEYAHLFGLRVHITLNTAIKEEEFGRALALARVAVESGADALIVSDIGLLTALKERTDIPLHLSTQAGVQNHLDAVFASSLGASRVILARETLPADIPAIKKVIPEVEIFIQGALCVSFSGGCLLGSVMYDSSGNRGVCNQACRLKYSAYDAEGNYLRTGYLLSPYDLSLGEDVRRLEKNGIDSLKIEGRLKRPVYVYSAVSYYRDILSGRDAESSLRALKIAFNRGFTKGYSLCKSDKIINVNVPAHIGIPVGTVERVTEKSGYKYAYLRSSYEFGKGDGAKILRDGREIGGSDVTSVTKNGDYTVIPVSSAVEKGDAVHLTTDAAAVYDAENVVNRLAISITLCGKVGEPLVLVGKCGDSEVVVRSSSCLQANTSGTNQAIIDKLSKVGNTDFFIEKTEDFIEGQVFLPVSEVNALRRELTEMLRSEVIHEHTPHYSFTEKEVSSVTCEERVGGSDVLVEVSSLTDIADTAENADAYVLHPNVTDIRTIQSFLREARKVPAFLRLPKIAREADILFMKRVLLALPTLGIFADNLYAVELARELKREYIAGYGLNIFNSRSAQAFSDARYVCSSVEYPYPGDTVFAAGKMPLMSFAHCPISVAYGRKCGECDKKVNELIYKNTDKTYRIRRTVWRDCQFTMYNDEVTKRIVPKDKNVFFSFVGVSSEEKASLIFEVKEVRKCIKA